MFSSYINIDSAIAALKYENVSHLMVRYESPEFRKDFFQALCNNQSIKSLILAMLLLTLEMLDGLNEVLNKNPALNYLGLSSVLTPMIVQELSKIINNIKKLQIIGGAAENNLSSELMSEISILLEKNIQLEEFHIVEVNDQHISLFIKAVFNNPNMRILKLQGYKIHEISFINCIELLMLNPFITNLELIFDEYQVDMPDDIKSFIQILNKENIELALLREANDSSYFNKIKQRYDIVFSAYKNKPEKIEKLNNSLLAKEATQVARLQSLIEKELKVWSKPESTVALKYKNMVIENPINWLWNNYYTGERGNSRFENYIQTMHEIKKKENFKEVHQQLLSVRPRIT